MCDSVPTKTCKGPCNRTLPLTGEYFYRLSSSPDGFHRYCVRCCKLNRATERVQQRDKRSGISYRQRDRARREHKHADDCIDDDITLAALYKKQQGRCAICHLFVKVKQASIDHIKAIKNGGTHTHDNVQMVHLKCNLHKGAK